MVNEWLRRSPLPSPGAGGIRLPWGIRFRAFAGHHAIAVTAGRHIMLKTQSFEIANIYVPTKRRATLKPATVQEIAASMLEVGQKTPILVRQDGARFVLVEGLHRLEASKALGETTIKGYLVEARKH